MTYSERLEIAMESLYEEYNPTDLDKLLQYAYFAGKEKGVREACDMATERYKEQLQRAKACRYHKMARAILGKDNPFTGENGFIYHPDYADDYTREFGDDIWNGD